MKISYFIFLMFLLKFEEEKEKIVFNKKDLELIAFILVDFIIVKLYSGVYDRKLIQKFVFS